MNKQMNLSNKLTIFRILLIPVFMLVLLSRLPFCMVIAAAVFLLASLTDLVDGKLARSRNMVTEFGKFLDPLADKLLVTSALICLIDLDLLSPWLAIIIIAREFLVTSIRLVMKDAGKVLPANKWGKAKTALQITAIMTLLLQDFFRIPPLVIDFTLGDFMMWLAALLTLISGGTYFWEAKSYINSNK